MISEIVFTACVRRSAWRAFFNVLLPIIIGAGIYTLWRSPHLLVFHWFDQVGLIHFVERARQVASIYRSSIPQIILYSLPDALWVYSFTAALVLIWETDSSSLHRLLWLLLPMVSAIGAEFGQAFHWVPGTFDWWDVFSYFIAGILGLKLSTFSPFSIHSNKVIDDIL